LGAALRTASLRVASRGNKEDFRPAPAVFLFVLRFFKR